MFRLLGSDNGFIHACGHRGHSIGAPENTLAALTATRAYGGSSAEIDVMLTADGEIVLMHDDFLDRTTNGSGLVSRATLAEIKALDGGSWFGAGFAGETVPTLAEAFAHAREIGLGLVVEVKEFQATDRLVDRLGALIEETGAADDAIFISFDHAFLKTLKDALPGIRTEGILHARHADVVAVALAADLDSVSVEHMMFTADDGEALHEEGIAVRLHLQRPDVYARYQATGLDLLADVRGFAAAGLIDTLSGDDVAFLSGLLAAATEGARAEDLAQSA
ncbi:MAG: glycerophosphodiester phosphodiesterase [Bauldia sp.]|nr:glycerophosphodiester phosphodiesterase [Bauldia sp.]